MIRKKILHVVSSMDPVLGGVSKAVRIIASSLIKESIVNEVVCLDNTDADFVINDSIKLHALGTRNNPWAYNPNLLPWLNDNILKFDYIIIHGLWLYNSYAVYKAVKNIKKHKNSKLPKYFVMPHGMLDPYFQKAKGRRLKAIRNWLYWKFIESKVVNSADGLLFTCEEEQQLARKPFLPYTPKSELIVGLGVESPPLYNALMDEAFFNSCVGLGERTFLLFLSRIHEKKGVDLLIEAYREIVKHPSEYLNSEYNIPALVIVGPGIETSYGTSLMKIISEDIELKNSVFFPGMLTGNAKWGAFYNSEAFILPSHQENFGIAVVESLACKKPVLISNQINIWKEINKEKAGIIDNDTLSGTTNILKKWMNLSFKEKKLMECRAEICYKSYFSIEALVESWKKKVFNLYD